MTKKVIKMLLLAYLNYLFVRMLKGYRTESRLNQTASIHIQISYKQSG